VLKSQIRITLKQIITETADEVICRIERAERNEWYDDECKDTTKIRMMSIIG
jgi:hypothetical protein